MSTSSSSSAPSRVYFHDEVSHKQLYSQHHEKEVYARRIDCEFGVYRGSVEEFIEKVDYRTDLYWMVVPHQPSFPGSVPGNRFFGTPVYCEHFKSNNGFLKICEHKLENGAKRISGFEVRDFARCANELFEEETRCDEGFTYLGERIGYRGPADAAHFVSFFIWVIPALGVQDENSSVLSRGLIKEILE